MVMKILVKILFCIAEILVCLGEREGEGKRKREGWGELPNERDHADVFFLFFLFLLSFLFYF